MYSFSHALVRETLQAEIPASRRLALQLEIGQALERVYAGELERHLGELAHHFLEAAPLGEVDRAVDYATHAAAQARARLAYEDAAALYERALEALELVPEADDRRRLDLLLALGEAQTKAAHAGDARATLERAAKLARRLGLPEQLARATLDICMLAVAGVVDEPLIELLEESLDAVGPGDSGLRSHLLSGLAQELYWVDAAGRSNELGLEALEMARRVGDPGALASALARRQFTGMIHPDQVRRRLAESDELHDLAKKLGDGELELRADLYRLSSRLQLGDIPGLDLDLAAVDHLAGQLRLAHLQWNVPLLRATRALIDGRFDDAEVLSREAAAAGVRAEEPVAAQFHATQIALLRRLRRSPEDEAELEALIGQLVELAERYPAIPAWRSSLAATHAQLDHRREARTVFETLAAHDFEDVPLDAQWAISLGLLAEVACYLGDVERARVLLRMLAPFEGLNLIAGRAAACYGPVSRTLGLLARTEGRLDDAERHFVAGLALSEAMGDRPFTAHTRFELATTLLDRDAAGDRERALELLAAALESAQELGMVWLVERALAARLAAQGLESLDVGTSIDFMIDEVASERPDIAAHAAPDGQVTILFSDIENSTLMTERLGDERWLAVLRAHNALFRELVPAHGGYEVKNQGDGFMLVFPDPARAIECATAIQRELVAREPVEGERVRVRIGMHAGEAIREEGDFFGRSVILAARIAAQARGGEILVSEELRRRAENGDRGAVGFDAGREVELKGLAGTHRVYRAEWETLRPSAS